MDSTFSCDQFRSAYPPGVEFHYWNRARNMIVLSKLKRYFPHVRHLLEVGCGTGIVVDFLRSKGLLCWGCDLASIHPVSRHVAPFIRFGTSSLALDDEWTDKIDTLLFLDLLEHLEDPHAFLKAHFARFTNARHLMITVPARQELWSNYDEWYGHVKRYDDIAARDLLRQTGFVTVAAGYFFHALYVPALVLSLVGMNRNEEIKAPTGLRKWAHSVVARCFWLESMMLPRYLYGSSLFLLARRP